MMARMIRSANHSSYPLGADDAGDEATQAIVVAEQSRAFLDIVTDGQVRWDPAACLDRDLRRIAPLALAGYLAAAAVTPKPVKVSLPGPAAFLSSLDREGPSARQAVTAALVEEVKDLGAAGCRWFQLEESIVHAAGCAAILDAAPAGSVTILWVGRANAAALLGLPGTHVGLDVTGADALEVLAHLPAGCGVVLGLFDVAREEVEDADDVAARLEPFREALAGRDLIVGPNGGLAALPRDLAFEKLLQARYLAEGLRRRWSLSASPR